MVIGTLKLNRVLQSVFGLLALLLFLLAVGDITRSAALKKIAGSEGIVCGISAIDAGLAPVLNESRWKDMSSP